MNITISENLKNMRKLKGNTQEEFATYLGISIQAVSKWERNEGYPDITLLPAIAVYYETTVDDLLGCGAIEQKKKIDKYMDKYMKNADIGRIKDNIALMRDALREFPNNLDIMEKLMNALFLVNKNEYLDEVITLGERILRKSVCDEQRYSAIQTLAYSYDRKNMIEKAKEYANRLPNSYCTSNKVRQALEKGENLRKLTQVNILNAIGSIDLSVTWMISSKEYTPEEKIFAYETVVKLYYLFINDGNFGYEHNNLFFLWSNIAKEYAKLQNREKALEALEKAHSHAVSMDNFKEGQHTSMFTDTVTSSKEGFSRNFEHSYMDLLRKTMRYTEFDFVRNSDKFKKMLS